MKQKVIFLDRDGVLNVDHGYVNEAKKWEWIDGVFEGLAALRDAGFIFAVVTNQSGIGHELYTEANMHALHDHMRDELAKKEITIEAIAFCPHRQDGACDCRKPKTGMLRQVKEKIGNIDYANSWMIGDKVKDMEFGQGIGVKTALVRSKYWKEDELSQQPDLIADSLFDFSQQITTT